MFPFAADLDLLQPFGLWLWYAPLRHPWLDKVHLFAANTCGVTLEALNVPEGPEGLQSSSLDFIEVIIIVGP